MRHPNWGASLLLLVILGVSMERMGLKVETRTAPVAVTATPAVVAQAAAVAPAPRLGLRPVISATATVTTTATSGILLPPIAESAIAVSINRRAFTRTGTVAPSPEGSATTTPTVTPTALDLGLPPPEEWTDVRGKPSLSAEKVDAILVSYGSPATGSGPAWVTHSERYGIDNAVALAFFIHESSAGTNPRWSGIKPDGSTTRNVGNIECAGYHRCFGRWRDYETWDEGIEDWYRLIAFGYIQRRGVTTVEEIIPIYAPVFENDVELYIATVLRRIGQFRNVPIELWPPIPTRLPTATPTETITATPEPPVAGAKLMPDLVGMDLDTALATLEQLGIAVGTVDMQTRERIPEIFDQVPPRTIISTQPLVDEWVLPDAGVVLGVRAPEEPATAPPDEEQPIAPPTSAPTSVKPPGWNVMPPTPTSPAAPPEPEPAPPATPTLPPAAPPEAPSRPTSPPAPVEPVPDLPDPGWET
ncbi:MAG: hypothetical protein ACLFVO_09585 [Chloroflexaceae bacterium]